MGEYATNETRRAMVYKNVGSSRLGRVPHARFATSGEAKMMGWTTYPRAYWNDYNYDRDRDQTLGRTAHEEGRQLPGGLDVRAPQARGRHRGMRRADRDAQRVGRGLGDLRRVDGETATDAVGLRGTLIWELAAADFGTLDPPPRAERQPPSQIHHGPRPHHRRRAEAGAARSALR